LHCYKLPKTSFSTVDPDSIAFITHSEEDESYYVKLRYVSVVDETWIKLTEEEFSERFPIPPKQPQTNELEQLKIELQATQDAVDFLLMGGM